MLLNAHVDHDIKAPVDRHLEYLAAAPSLPRDMQVCNNTNMLFKHPQVLGHENDCCISVMIVCCWLQACNFASILVLELNDSRLPARLTFKSQYASLAVELGCHDTAGALSPRHWQEAVVHEVSNKRCIE